MDITYRLKKGSFNQAMSKVDRSINFYAGDNHVKIGITCNPESRCSGYRSETNYDQMVVLYKTDLLDTVRSAEKDLVDYHWEKIENGMQK